MAAVAGGTEHFRKCIMPTQDILLTKNRKIISVNKRQLIRAISLESEKKSIFLVSF